MPGLDLAIARGWLWLHEGGTYVKLTEAGKGHPRLNPGFPMRCL
ncbi:MULTISPECIES: hypothetical protein [unclassified Bradyrhizobium]|nr:MULTISPECIES: hypothetical protein [unclassified Bradyrhizobium]